MTQAQGIGNNLNPKNVGNFQSVLRMISRDTYAKQAKTDSQNSALAGAGAKASDVSGGTFASVMGALEQMRGGDISKEYAAGVQGYKDTLDAIEKQASSGRASSTTALDNAKKAIDLIQSYKDQGLPVPASLYALAGTYDPTNTLSPQEVAIKQTIINGGDTIGKPVGQDGFADPDTYNNVRDQYIKEVAGDDPIAQENARKDFDNKFGDVLDPEQKDRWTQMGINIPEQDPSTQKTYEQYGLLANVKSFDPTNRVDKQAKQYLDYYIKNATIPTYYSLFGRTSSGSSINFSAIQERAQQLYYEATGSALPDANILKANKVLITGNNKLLNNLNIQEGTINNNFKLAIDNLDKSGINQQAQPINQWINYIRDTLGDPAVAQYLTQNGTIANEMSSLLALKNASGTTVADKLEAAGLLPVNATEDQQKAILKILMQEAENSRSSINSATSDLYKQIDPLETELNNPNRVGKTTQKTQNFQTSTGLSYTILP